MFSRIDHGNFVFLSGCSCRDAGSIALPSIELSRKRKEQPYEEIKKFHNPVSGNLHPFIIQTAAAQPEADKSPGIQTQGVDKTPAAPAQKDEKAATATEPSAENMVAESS